MEHRLHTVVTQPPPVIGQNAPVEPMANMRLTSLQSAARRGSVCRCLAASRRTSTELLPTELVMFYIWNISRVGPRGVVWCTVWSVRRISSFSSCCEMFCICHGKRSVAMGALQKASVRPGKLLGNPSSLRCKVQLGIYPGSVYVYLCTLGMAAWIKSDDATFIAYITLSFDLQIACGLEVIWRH